MHEHIQAYFENEKRLNSINTATISPPSSVSKGEKSKFSKYRTEHAVSICTSEEIENLKKFDSPIKSSLKKSTHKFDYKIESPVQERQSFARDKNTVNMDLKRVSSQNLDDFEEKKEDEIEKTKNSFEKLSDKNSFDEIPLEQSFSKTRRQSSITKSLRLSYISRKKSLIKEKNDFEDANEKEEKERTNHRLMYRQRRSNLIDTNIHHFDHLFVLFLCCNIEKYNETVLISLYFSLLTFIYKILHFQGTFVESTIRNIDQTTSTLLEHKKEKKRFIKNIFEVNLSYELFNCGQTTSYSDGEIKNVSLKEKKKMSLKDEEDGDDIVMFLSDNCLDRVFYTNSNNMDALHHDPEMNIGINDFEFLKLISKGAYGRVWLVKRIKTGDIYAMKIVNFAEKVVNYII